MEYNNIYLEHKSNQILVYQENEQIKLIAKFELVEKHLFINQEYTYVNFIINKIPNKVISLFLDYYFKKYDNNILIKINDYNLRKILLNKGFSLIESKDDFYYYAFSKDKYLHKLNVKRREKYINNNNINICDKHWDGA